MQGGRLPAAVLSAVQRGELDKLQLLSRAGHDTGLPQSSLLLDPSFGSPESIIYGRALTGATVTTERGSSSDEEEEPPDDIVHVLSTGTSINRSVTVRIGDEQKKCSKRHKNGERRGAADGSLLPTMSFIATHQPGQPQWGTMRDLVQQYRDRVLEVIQQAEADSRALHDGTDTTLIGGLKLECGDLLYKLMCEVPETTDLDFAKLGRSNDLYQLKQEIALLKQKATDLKRVNLEKDTLYLLTMAKLTRREKAIAYIRRTLYREVCLLREQLLRLKNSPVTEEDIKLFSLFDFIKVLEYAEDPDAEARLRSLNYAMPNEERLQLEINDLAAKWRSEQEQRYELQQQQHNAAATITVVEEKFQRLQKELVAHQAAVDGALDDDTSDEETRNHPEDSENAEATGANTKGRSAPAGRLSEAAGRIQALVREATEAVRRYHTASEQSQALQEAVEYKEQLQDEANRKYKNWMETVGKPGSGAFAAAQQLLAQKRGNLNSPSLRGLGNPRNRAIPLDQKSREMLIEEVKLAREQRDEFAAEVLELQMQLDQAQQGLASAVASQVATLQRQADTARTELHTVSEDLRELRQNCGYAQNKLFQTLRDYRTVPGIPLEDTDMFEEDAELPDLLVLERLLRSRLNAQRVALQRAEQASEKLRGEVDMTQQAKDRRARDEEQFTAVRDALFQAVPDNTRWLLEDALRRVAIGGAPAVNQRWVCAARAALKRGATEIEMEAPLSPALPAASGFSTNTVSPEAACQTDLDVEFEMDKTDYELFRELREDFVAWQRSRSHDIWVAWERHRDEFYDWLNGKDEPKSPGPKHGKNSDPKVNKTSPVNTNLRTDFNRASGVTPAGTKKGARKQPFPLDPQQVTRTEISGASKQSPQSPKTRLPSVPHVPKEKEREKEPRSPTPVQQVGVSDRGFERPHGRDSPPTPSVQGTDQSRPATPLLVPSSGLELRSWTRPPSAAESAVGIAGRSSSALDSGRTAGTRPPSAAQALLWHSQTTSGLHCPHCGGAVRLPASHAPLRPESPSSPSLCDGRNSPSDLETFLTQQPQVAPRQVTFMSNADKDSAPASITPPEPSSLDAAQAAAAAALNAAAAASAAVRAAADMDRVLWPVELEPPDDSAASGVASELADLARAYTSASAGPPESPEAYLHRFAGAVKGGKAWTEMDVWDRLELIARHLLQRIAVGRAVQNVGRAQAGSRPSSAGTAQAPPAESHNATVSALQAAHLRQQARVNELVALTRQHQRALTTAPPENRGSVTMPAVSRYLRESVARHQRQREEVMARLQEVIASENRLLSQLAVAEGEIHGAGTPQEYRQRASVATVGGDSLPPVEKSHQPAKGPVADLARERNGLTRQASVCSSSSVALENLVPPGRHEYSDWLPNKECASSRPVIVTLSSKTSTAKKYELPSGIDNGWKSPGPKLHEKDRSAKNDSGLPDIVGSPQGPLTKKKPKKAAITSSSASAEADSAWQRSLSPPAYEAPSIPVWEAGSATWLPRSIRWQHQRYQLQLLDVLEGIYADQQFEMRQECQDQVRLYREAVIEGRQNGGMEDPIFGRIAPMVFPTPATALIMAMGLYGADSPDARRQLEQLEQMLPDPVLYPHLVVPPLAAEGTPLGMRQRPSSPRSASLPPDRQVTDSSLQIPGKGKSRAPRITEERKALLRAEFEERFGKPLAAYRNR
eukprot:TRINITY_DN3445_c0_g1_i1.p1 TRINITY_DN3445_c0_g1~~TRINITY_DN3445_c0_g1_i1.p1  ORF type:complete len:1683 (+),score=253.83 TRINITY_DN3445_c0_g1_i1:30-5078(+)